MPSKDVDILSPSEYLTSIMEMSYGEKLGRSILQRQCEHLNIDLNEMDHSGFKKLSQGVYDAIKLFGKEKADTVRNKIENAVKLLPREDIEQWERDVNTADASTEMGRLKAALKLYESALESIPEDDKNRAEIFGKMGYLYQRLERYDKCEIYYDRAIKNTSDPGSKAQFIDGKSSALWRQGDHQKALSTAKEALPIIETMPTHALALDREKRLRKAAIYRGIGNIYLDLSNKAKAIEYCKKAIDIYEDIGLKGPAGSVYNNMARVYEDYEEFSASVTYYEKAVELCKDSGNMFMQGWSIFNLASALCELGRAEEALDRCHDAKMIMEDFDHTLGKSRVECMQGKANKMKGDHDKAEEHFKKSLELLKDSNAPDYEEITILEYARMLADWGRIDKAKEMLITAQEIHGDKPETITSKRVNEFLQEIEVPT